MFAFYAHFAPGSIEVAVGDRMTTGQSLGLLGNSGNSAGPHLHFVLLDAPSALLGTSLPMEFDQYTLVGTLDIDLVAEMDVDPTGSLRYVGEPQEQINTLQLVPTIANFP